MSLGASRAFPVTVWLAEAMLRREGRAQAGQDELSKERLLPAGKGSFTTCGIALTTFAAHRVLSAQGAELSLCSGWFPRQGWCLWILGVKKGSGIEVGGRGRVEAAPSQATKIFSELLCCRTAAKHTQPACAAARGHRGAPKPAEGCGSAPVLFCCAFPTTTQQFLRSSEQR